MVNHPNRGRPGKPGSNPKPDEMRALRHSLGLTQKQAAELIWCGVRTWEQWEAGDRSCHPAFWELFRIKSGAQ